MNASQPSPPNIYAVVVSWNRPADTLACLESLYNQEICPQVVLVDNASTDDTLSQVRNRFPQAHILANKDNLGFGRATNQGMRTALEAGADWILIANNDAVLAPDGLSLLLEQAAPDVGMLAPLIYFDSHPQVIWSAGGNTNSWNLEKSGDPRGQPDPGSWPDHLDRDFITGCVALFPRQTLEIVGLFDERFQMYYEDSDLCRRVRQAGLHIRVIPAAKAWHKVAMSSGGTDTPNERYWMARSSVIFFRKHARGIQKAVVIAWRAGSAVRTSLRLVARQKWPALGAYWRGLRDGWKESLPGL